jgi:hypothetical protein
MSSTRANIPCWWLVSSAAPCEPVPPNGEVKALAIDLSLGHDHREYRRLLHHRLLRHALAGPDGRIFADTLTQDLPLVIEIVDSEVNKFVDAIEGMMGSALVTTEKVKVIQYGTKRIE